MKSVSSKNKIWIIITVILLAVGMTLVGVLGFNNTVDGKGSYEVNVSIDANIDDASSKVQKAAEDYFAEVGIKDRTYTRQVLNDDCIALYKFDNDVTDKLDKDKLYEKVTLAIEDSGLIVEVSINEVVPFGGVQSLWVILALGIILVAIFIYLLFMAKLSGSVAVLFTMVLSALTYIAMLGITRLPANGFAITFGLASALIAGIQSTGIIGRIKEELKNEGNSKLSYKEVADKATYHSTLRFCLFLASVLVISVLLIALGTGYLRFYGISLIVASVVSSFISYTFTAFIWTAIKNTKKDKKSKTTSTPETVEEQ